MSIAILYICTGKYDVFWAGFHQSSEHFFCPSYKKDYYVFTDSKQIKSTENVHVIPQDNLGWPLNTLYRYKMFLRIQGLLLKYDYVVYINSNAEFVSPVNFEDFFGINKKLIACLHPGFFNKSIQSYTYETRKQSLANVDTPHHYFAGGINGGKTAKFLSVIDIISKNIENDLANGIMALWHDESHWNAFLNNNFEKIQNDLHILSPAYLYPKGWNLPFEPKIILRDKTDYFKVYDEKGTTQPCGLKSIIKKIIHKIFHT